MKVVINKCHGGFGLSEEGVRAYATRKGWDVYAEGDGIWKTYWKVPAHERTGILEGKAFHSAAIKEKHASNRRYSELTIGVNDIERSDADLIAVVEELGERADGCFAKLRVVEIPDDVDWTIEEYDGAEWIAEVHETWG